MDVVIRYIPVFDKFYICHAGSYQNAFGNKVNGFVSRLDASRFAWSKACKIVFHEYDALQQNRSDENKVECNVFQVSLFEEC